MNWNYEGDFLKQFDDWERNFVTQMACRAYRGLSENYRNAPDADKVPAENLTQMMDRFDREITERSANEWIGLELRLLLAKLTTQLRSDGMKDFFRFIAKREKIDPAAKQEIKAQNARAYANKAMASKPPSPKQIEWLKKNNAVIPATAREASEMLGKIFGK